MPSGVLKFRSSASDLQTGAGRHSLKCDLNVLFRVGCKIEAEGHHSPPQVHSLPHILLICRQNSNSWSCAHTDSTAEYNSLLWKRIVPYAPVMADVTGLFSVQGNLLSLREEARASCNAFDALDKYESWQFAQDLMCNT